MPKSISDKELDDIIELLVEYPEGVSTEVIHKVLPVQLSRRTLQRRLDIMVNTRE